MRPADYDDYAWLRAECEFRLRIQPEGYAAREVIAAGDVLYDAQLCWAEAGGSVLICDIGGQPRRGWDPEQGHGAFWRLHCDDSLTPVVPPGNMGRGMPLTPRLAPSSFPPWEGHVFFVGQTAPGRAGALAEHAVYRLAPGADRPEIFAVVPAAGSIGSGVPGAMVCGPFGAVGRGHEGTLFVMSLMNCTVYGVQANGSVSPHITLAPPITRHPIMPRFVFYAPPHWGALADELFIGGLRNTSFEREARTRVDVQYWRLLDPENFDDNPIDGPVGGHCAVVAPPEFGPLGGHAFWCDEGSTNLLHVTRSPIGPLPYDATIYHMALDGSVGVFADRLQGGRTSIVFDDERMVIGCVRKSYSTGEYHEPDSSVYEVRWTGSDTPEAA